MERIFTARIKYISLARQSHDFEESPRVDFYLDIFLITPTMKRKQADNDTTHVDSDSGSDVVCHS